MRLSDHKDIVDRLKALTALKVGDPLPQDWPENDWGTPLSELLREAVTEIEWLRARLQRKQADERKNMILRTREGL